MNQKGAAPLLILIAIVGLVGFLIVTSYAPLKNNLLSTLFPKEKSQAATSFLDNFNIAPSSPQVFDPPNWDVNVVVTGGGDGAEGWKNMASMYAMHGADCSAPIATHFINNQFDAVFSCQNHMMTSINYGIAYLTPNHMVDFSNGEAVINWDVSTFTSTGRDWWYIWIQPFNDNFAVPLEDWIPVFSGEPKRALAIKMEGGTLNGIVINDYNSQVLPHTSAGFLKISQVLQQHGFNVDSDRRDTFEIRISKNHLKVCMTKIGSSTTTPTPVNHCWIDSNMADLGWDKGLVTIGHQSYNPSKDCTPVPPLECSPNTWHWDNVSISPSIPYTLIKGDTKGVKTDTTDTVNFPAPAPANAFLRFVAMGTIQTSFNNGQTWQPAQKRQQEKNAPEHYSNYWMPIPQGTTSVKFKGSPDSYISNWIVRDPIVMSESIDPNATPTSTPSPTPIPSPSPSPSPAPAGSITIDFNNSPQGNLTGQNPSGVINWDGSSWSIAGPWKGLNTNNLSFRSQAITSGTFTLIQPRVVNSIQAYNGGTAASNVTLSCSGNPDKTVSVGVEQLATITTNWTNPCTTVTLSSSNAWNTNFDNLSLGPVSTSQSPQPSAQPSTAPSVAPSQAPSTVPSPSNKPGDTDADNDIDIFDYNQVLGDFGSTNPQAKGNVDGIITPQGISVDIFDYNLVLSNFNK